MLADHDGQALQAPQFQVGQMDPSGRGLVPLVSGENRTPLGNQPNPSAGCDPAEVERLIGLFAKHGMLGDPNRRHQLAIDVTLSGHSKLITDLSMRAMLRKCTGMSVPIFYIAKVLREDPQWPVWVKKVTPVTGENGTVYWP